MAQEVEYHDEPPWLMQDMGSSMDEENAFPNRNAPYKSALNYFEQNGVYTVLLLNIIGFFVSFWIQGPYLPIVLFIVFCSFLFAGYLLKWCMQFDAGSGEMRKVADAIREGSEGFLSIQYGTIARMAFVVGGIIFLIYAFRTPPAETHVGATTHALLTTISFLLGAFCSALAGYLGVWVGVRINVRVASTASRGSYYGALLVAFRGGAIASIVSAAMCILGISLLYITYYIIFVRFHNMQPTFIPLLLAGYGFGASFVSLFMQLGGGIYTKAADVGADMVGKVEAGIPEDDPRNPAVIADLVGDNVGDCAGSMADVFESIAAELIGTMILGGVLAVEAKISNPERYIFFPLIIHACDLVVSSIGIYMLKGTPGTKEWESPLALMKHSYMISMAIAVVLLVAVTRLLLYSAEHPDAWWHFALCGLLGILTSYALVHITQYYTDYAHGPVQSIAMASTTGHGTNVIQGMSVGLVSTGLPALTIAVSVLIAYSLGSTSGLPEQKAGLYGTAVATMGMLCTAVYVIAMNNFGPIADNAGGIVEMSNQSEGVRKITDRLDAIGNVTKAATKGYAVGGSAMAAFILFRAYMDEVSAYSRYSFDVVDIGKIEVLIGGLLGIMMIFVFTGWAIAAVGTTAQEVVKEVRRQFREKPGIMEGYERPEYDTCVAIVTRAALSQMVKPALLGLGMPVVVGLVFRYVGVMLGKPWLGPEVLAGFLMFATLTGFLFAIFLDNSGGAWDNAKKYIEAGAHGGKGSLAHKAAVTGDTVGDPFKDTAGPALHVIMTTMSTTVLVLTPLFIP
eukprot:CAMPEP_0184341708 /NCGR_PEP_ID=MMETSP1089-20130417/10321_1 /TAXON_ID=38269 ORGANISM="Gloeochaete wittrockiana, Strain SAG46.84" /NCGR_SAMPLE_ID=MMETSP1089 /ASSEMBLY_ACC=CAM_ASM_000445 /LENGTH=793 /DNA_ID=CAMNT_0026670157 /DNA_START=36 /DNA_END=2417 /DNA_ORIENTATION=-